MAIVLGAWESHVQGEGPQPVGSLVATLLDGNAWESWQRPVERERGVRPFRRRPDAVKACATGRGAESLTQSGGIRKDIPGSSD